MALEVQQVAVVCAGGRATEVTRRMDLEASQKLPVGDTDASNGLSPYFWAAFVPSGNWR
jgi:hypothetical protein